MKYFPDIKELKILERNSQKNGSGIVYEELLGIWKFQYVWGKDTDEIKNIPSSILQVLSAKLELKKKYQDDSWLFEIQNSINFGILNIVFFGNATLKGPRPLLYFYFQNLQVNIGNFLIINKPFKKPEDKKMPFFSLIGVGQEDDWMSARGRGGGLAIWIRS